MDKLSLKDFEALHENVWNYGLIIPSSLGEKMIEVNPRHVNVWLPKQNRMSGKDDWKIPYTIRSHEVRMLSEGDRLFFSTIIGGTPCWYCRGINEVISEYLERTKGSIVPGKSVRIVGNTSVPGDYRTGQYDKCCTFLRDLEQKMLGFGAKDFRVIQADPNL